MTANNEKNRFVVPRQGYYIIKYKLNDVQHVDKYDSTVKPSFVMKSLRSRGATDFIITKY